MERREFLKATAYGGAALLLGVPPERLLAASAGDLSEHRIEKFGRARIRDRFPRKVGANSRGRVVGRGGGYQVRTVTTDRGVTGWAMCHVGDDLVRPFVGRRVSDLISVEQGLLVDAPFLDVMLHDLAGRILGKPVFRMIGGKGPSKIDLYSGAIYFDDLLPEDEPRGVEGVLASCRQDYEAGYRAFKLKIGRGFKWMEKREGLKRDIEVTRAVRVRFSDCKVLVDANDGYTVEDMIGYVRTVADCDLYWIEEPFEENREDLLKLREAMDKAGCKVLIADGESRKERAPKRTKWGGFTERFIERLEKLGREKLVDVFLMDLGIVGFSQWRKIMPELEAIGVKASPHTWMCTPRPFYAAQLAGGVGNVDIVEGIPGSAREIDYSAYKISGGGLVLPDVPGMGLRWKG